MIIRTRNFSSNDLKTDQPVSGSRFVQTSEKSGRVAKKRAGKKWREEKDIRGWYYSSLSLPQPHAVFAHFFSIHFSYYLGAWKRLQTVGFKRTYHYTFLGNCPPTPPLSQNSPLSEK